MPYHALCFAFEPEAAKELQAEDTTTGNLNVCCGSCCSLDKTRFVLTT